MKAIGHALLVVGLAALCVACVFNGHNTAAGWLGFFVFCAL